MIGRIEFNTSIRLGKQKAIRLKCKAKRKFKARRLVFLVPSPNFFIIEYFKLDDVDQLIGDQHDAYTFNPIALGLMLEFPIAQDVNIYGVYTGYLHPQFKPEYDFNMRCLLLEGSTEFRSVELLNP
jgi:hypothetical protein